MQALRFDRLDANGVWGGVFALVLALSLLSPAWAGPGAHGPGGEHLDAPATAAAAGGVPRVEASSDLFELVGMLYAGELSLLIDRFETNEPVLDAQVEVESGGLKAVAKFHAEHGDYAVDDARLLALLRQPGEHALVFTIVKGQESDLLDGTLSPAAATALIDEHDIGLGAGGWLTLVIGGLVLAAGVVWFLRRRRATAMLPTLGEHA
ncbi:MAG: hypothetical protein Q8R72_00700 [Hylemonella sp.]|nr:hypothetical protein [Hylemonella sp.]